MATVDRTWHVLLVGGASGVGKTSLASALGRRYGVDVTQLDDIQTALETITTPEQQPLIHFWRTSWAEFSAYTDDEHVNHFLDVSRLYSRVLAAVVADRLDGGTPVIIEGGFILPELAIRADFDGQPNEGRVRAVFVDEHDEAQIAANVVSREAGGDTAYDTSLPARTSLLKARWLQRECERLGIPTVAARPWATAAERAVAALSG